MPPISRGFFGRRADVDPSRLPPGQYLTRDFPVLSAGPTPKVHLHRWTFSIEGEVDEPRSWTWEELTALPAEEVTVDIHCVTKWTKLDTTWKGVSLDTLLAGVATEAAYVTVFCDGGYTTNLPLEDLTDGKAWVAYEYDGAPLEPEHGGPVRLLVPHLYFWKSAKWVRGLRLDLEEEPGLLGGRRLPHLRRPLARAALLGRLSRREAPMATCTHLDQVEYLAPPDEIAGCEECLKTGDRWVHLRMCQTCGKIGCCDSSPNRHASRHAAEDRSPHLPVRRARRGVVVVRDR